MTRVALRAVQRTMTTKMKATTVLQTATMLRLRTRMIKSSSLVSRWIKRIPTKNWWDRIRNLLALENRPPRVCRTLKSFSSSSAWVRSKRSQRWRQIWPNWKRLATCSSNPIQATIHNRGRKVKTRNLKRSRGSWPSKKRTSSKLYGPARRKKCSHGIETLCLTKIYRDGVTYFRRLMRQRRRLSNRATRKRRLKTKLRSEGNLATLKGKEIWIYLMIK